jgi:large conductance mechanosensitive channel
MRKLWQEFKGFAFKGNVIDLAVAVVIGAAFGTVIKSLVENVIMPTVSYVAPSSNSYKAWHLGRIAYGQFFGDVVSFLTVALAVFMVIVKMLGAVQRVALPPKPAEPTTKECPLCLSVIPLKARRCAHCTADLGGTPLRGESSGE